MKCRANLALAAFVLLGRVAWADADAFAAAAGYIPGGFIKDIQPGALLWVDKIGDDPGCSEILCTATEAVGLVDLTETQLPGAQYTAHADRSPPSSLAEILQETNNASTVALISRLTLTIIDARRLTLPDHILASPMRRAKPQCLARLAVHMRDRRRNHGWPVMLTSELKATQILNAGWVPPIMPAVERLMVMHWLAQYLPINGGRVSSDQAWGAPQRIGWQHDQSSMLGELTVAAGHY